MHYLICIRNLHGEKLASTRAVWSSRTSERRNLAERLAGRYNIDPRDCYVTESLYGGIVDKYQLPGSEG